MSSRVMNILSTFTPDIQVYSIDEAFLKFEGFEFFNLEEYGIKIQKTVTKNTGIQISVGFAPTKALSKIANRIAKKFKERTEGVYIIDSEEKRIKALKWTKIEDVWGIGFRLAKKMQAKGILKAYDFTLSQHEAFIKQTMGVVGLRLRLELLGESVLPLEEQPEAKKNIAVTRTFEKAITTLDAMRDRVSTFATVASEKLRKQNSCCYGIILYLRKDKYRIGNERYNFSKYERLPFATQSALTISQVALKMLNELFAEGQIRIANQDLNRTWKMKQNHLSKRYTTNLKELLEVKCISQPK